MVGSVGGIDASRDASNARATTRSNSGFGRMFPSSSGKRQAVGGPVLAEGDVTIPTHEPRLSLFIQQATGGVQGAVSSGSFSALARTLLEAPDRLKNDKVFKAKTFQSLLQSLYLYEYIPSDVTTRLLPCLDTLDAKQDARLYRMLLYLIRKDVSRGHVGTPTIVEHSGTTFAPDAVAVKHAVECARSLALNPKQRLGVRRYAIYTAAAASRQGCAKSMDIVGSLLIEAIKQIDELDDQGAQVGDSQTDWDLQRSVYGALRVSGLTGHPISQSCFLGVVSPDPIGARHALALAEEIAVRTPNVVVTSLGPLMEATCAVYEGEDLVDGSDAMQVINLKGDALARTHMARICAHVVHADQGSLSADSPGGKHFWRMLVLLISQDESDMVRFAALNALSGNVVSSADGVLGPTTLGKSRDHSLVQQRRARSWRTLASQAGKEVLVNVEGMKGLKFIDLVGRLILLALSKPVRKARFTAAAAVVASIAKSKLAHAASSSGGGDLSAKSPDLDRFITVLAKEMGNLIESPISGGQRAACIEALLYMQAAGVPVSLSASSFTLVGADGGSGGAQDSLLVAVLHCARSCPDDAPLFLEYASGVVGIAPEAVDLQKVAALWDAACDQSNKEAALVAALAALRSPLPPSAASGAGASYHRALAAARSDAGWTSFVATAAWWLGERANSVCDERCGKTVNAVLLGPGPRDGRGPKSQSSDDDASSVFDSDRDADDADDGEDGEDADDGEDGEDGEDMDGRGRTRISNVSPSSILRAHAGANASLSVVISALNDVILSGNWQLRTAAALAIAKIALRSGEPYRLHCYGILLSVSLGSHGQDSLGLQGVVKSAIDALDQVYGSQAIIDRLWEEHGDDLAEWPEDVLESISRRSNFLHELVESTVCSLPKQSAAFNLLGLKALNVCAHHLGEAAEDSGEDNDFPGGITANPKRAKDLEIENILGGVDSSRSSQAFQRKEDRMTELESLLMKSEGGEAGWNTAGVDRITRRMSRDSYGRSLDGHSSLDGSSLDLSPRASSLAAMTMATMVHTFIAAPDHPEELSIFEGDVVEVINLHGQAGWALVKDPSGHQGLVPRSYLDVGEGGSLPSISPREFSPRGFAQDVGGAAYDLSANRLLDLVDDELDGLQSASPVAQIPQVPQPAVVVQHTTAIYHDDGGNVDRSAGKTEPVATAPPMTSPPTHRIVHPFSREEEGELSVEIGERIAVISESGGWTKVMRVDGMVGLVPSWAIAMAQEPPIGAAPN